MARLWESKKVENDKVPHEECFAVQLIEFLFKMIGLSQKPVDTSEKVNMCASWFPDVCVCVLCGCICPITQMIDGSMTPIAKASRKKIIIVADDYEMTVQSERSLLYVKSRQIRYVDGHEFQW